MAGVEIDRSEGWQLGRRLGEALMIDLLHVSRDAAMRRSLVQHWTEHVLRQHLDAVAELMGYEPELVLQGTGRAAPVQLARRIAA